MESMPISYNYFNEIPSEMDLLAAASIGDLSLVHRLLQQGANVDQTNESGWTPLMYAAHYGHYNVVKMLIDYGANVNICENVQGRTPLMLAASCGHTRCLEVLITLGAADIEMTDAQGHNAAYYAIHSGHGRNKIIAKLLKIQGKSRNSSNSTTAPSSSSHSNSNSSSTSTGPSTSSSSSSSTEVSSSSRLRPLTKGKCQAGTISSNQISSTTKPDIIISQDNNIGPIREDSSPFPHGNGRNNNTNDSGSYYSPYLPLSRDGSPIEGQYSPITSPFSVNNGLTPQITFDRLLGKRRLPMGNQLNGQPSQKIFRRDQVSSSSTTSETGYNILVSASCSSQQHQQIIQQQSNLTSSSSPSSSLSTQPQQPPIINEKESIVSSDQNGSNLNRSRSPLPENLDTLLERIDLSQYSSLFSSHGIDLYCFLTLNVSDFEELGITLLGHKRKLYMAQLRFRESVEIASTQERFFADWLLSERENLKKENHELKMKLKGVDSSCSPSVPIYN